jgi:hypothetical protein
MFSDDDRYIAIGCEYSALIFEMLSGDLVCSIEDVQPVIRATLYTKHFLTPDGKYLITRSEE